MGIPKPRNLDICIGLQGEQWGCPCRCRRLVLVIPMRLSRISHIRRIAQNGYPEFLLLVLKITRSTLSDVNLTPCVYYTSSKSITLRLMPEDGLRKRIEQVSLGFQPHVREPEARILEVVAGCGVAGWDDMIDQPARRGREQAQVRGEKTPNANEDVGEPGGTLVFRVRALCRRHRNRWDDWRGWDNEQMTSIGVWKDLARHHRFACGVRRLGK